MEQNIPFIVDHFGIGTPDLMGATYFLQNLGFFTGSTRSGRPDELTHFVFDNCYLECAQISKDELLPSPTRVEVKGGPGVYAFIMNTLQPKEVHAAVEKAGFSTSEISWGFGRDADHGEKKGWAIFNAFFLNPAEPLTSMFVGIVNHGVKELIYQKERYVHENGVNKISSFVLYFDTPEKLLAAKNTMGKLEDTVQGFADPMHLNRLRFVDKNAYESEFGVPVPTIKSIVAAVTFKDGDLDFLHRKAEAMKLPNFDKGGKLYIDARKDTGVFLIFE